MRTFYQLARRRTRGTRWGGTFGVILVVLLWGLARQQDARAFVFPLVPYFSAIIVFFLFLTEELRTPSLVFDAPGIHLLPKRTGEILWGTACSMFLSGLYYALLALGLLALGLYLSEPTAFSNIKPDIRPLLTIWLPFVVSFILQVAHLVTTILFVGFLRRWLTQRLGFGRNFPEMVLRVLDAALSVLFLLVQFSWATRLFAHWPAIVNTRLWIVQEVGEHLDGFFPFNWAWPNLGPVIGNTDFGEGLAPAILIFIVVMAVLQFAASMSLVEDRLDW